MIIRACDPFIASGFEGIQSVFLFFSKNPIYLVCWTFTRTNIEVNL